ncbi:MAG: hypothetical protein ACHQ49_03755 [Elusimicrobiota bacterium]
MSKKRSARAKNPAPRPEDAVRVRRLQRLSFSLDLDAFAASIIVDLLEELDEARRELDRARRAAGG